jgi:hypothetical protein
MGNLSNLYVSQSFQSLIHLGTDSSATSTLTTLQDGLGNSIGIAVSTNGNLYLTGSLTASLTNGYVLVGDSNNRTTLVATSSFGGGSSINTGSFVTTSSFNAYTASTNSSITQLNASSASQQISINALNGATSSYATSAITASSLITASVSGQTMTFTKGDATTFNVTLPAGSGSVINTSSFATTGSNTFVGGQRISGSNDNHIYINRPGGLEVLRMGVSDNGNTFDFIITGSGFSPKDIWLIDNQGGTYGNTFLGFVQAEGRTNINAPFTGSQGAQINGGNLVIQSGSNGLVVHGNKQFNVGAFQSNITQSGSANVSQSMRFETTDISQGISMVSNSRITLVNSGTYNIQFSAQLLADTGADTVWIWLKKNGTNVSSTSTKLVLRNNEADVAAWNFVVDAAASDYFELAWQGLGGHTKLFAEAAAGNYPAIPSIILTVTQAR